MVRQIIVDESDTPIGFKERSEITSTDIYRATALWLTNSNNEVLLARRAYTKEKDPGVWGPAVGGTVDEGEEYDDNIVKEIKEEIGLDIPITNLQRGPKTESKNRLNQKYFIQWYTYTIDLPAEDFIIEPKEVEEVKWFPISRLLDTIASNPEEFTLGAQKWKNFLLA